MYGSEMAKLRIDDMVRDADAYRRTRGTRTARAGELRGKIRTVARSVLSALTWPIKH